MKSWREPTHAKSDSRGQARWLGWRVAALAAAIVVAACEPAPPTSSQLAAPDAWREFDGTWTAAGVRQTLHLGDQRQASTARFSGSLQLAGPGRPAVGFRADAIVFDDSATGLAGRAVWIDERGDEVYSELRAEAGAPGRRIVGNFVGGSGRYAGAEGRYEFGWRFLLEAEDGTVQGQSIGLKGLVRFAAPAAATPPQGAQR